MGLATGEGGSLQGKKLNSCDSKPGDCSHLATSEPLPFSTPLNSMLSAADALHPAHAPQRLPFKPPGQPAMRACVAATPAALQDLLSLVSG